MMCASSLKARIRPRRDIPVIFVTAKSQVEDLEHEPMASVAGSGRLHHQASVGPPIVTGAHASTQLADESGCIRFPASDQNDFP